MNEEFRVVYADPPWEYRHKVSGRKGRGAAAHHYPTMTINDLCLYEFPARVAKDAMLWLWVPSPILAEGEYVKVIKAWGFKPQTICTWVKYGLGMGYTLRSATEHLLVARRGTPVVKDRGVPTRFVAPRLRHSEKPEEARAIIERVCDGPYMELFARRRVPGWESWGDEIDE